MDFARPVFCVLGFPFDALTMDEAVRRIKTCVLENRRCHVATPNANFLRLAQSDPDFRDAVLTSDLCVLDGMPLVWLARTLGVPIPQRITGSDIFEALRRGAGGRIGAFFLGGTEETCRSVRQRLQGEHAGVYCAGACAPGFGSIDEMSRPEIIACINAVRPDLVTVSIGARKGLLWLARNEMRLLSPVICNLGATINFVAGTLNRAPRFLQRLGLEWLWRIKEEPGLWKRYAADFEVLVAAVARQVLPSLVSRMRRGPSTSGFASARVQHVRRVDVDLVTFSGAFGERNLGAVRAKLAAATARASDLVLDMENVSAVDAAFLGLALIAYGHQRRMKRGFVLNAPGRRLRASLRRHGCGFLLSSAQSASPY